MEIFNLAKKITIKTLEQRTDISVYEKIVQANRVENQIDLLFGLMDNTDRINFMKNLAKEKSPKKKQVFDLFVTYLRFKDFVAPTVLRENDQLLAKYSKIC